MIPAWRRGYSARPYWMILLINSAAAGMARIWLARECLMRLQSLRTVKQQIERLRSHSANRSQDGLTG
jgi:hypothetical protein